MDSLLLCSLANLVLSYFAAMSSLLRLIHHLLHMLDCLFRISLILSGRIHKKDSRIIAIIPIVDYLLGIAKLGSLTICRINKLLLRDFLTLTYSSELFLSQDTID